MTVSLLGSTPRPILPAVMWAAFRVIALEPVDRELLINLLAPPALRAEEGRPDGVITAIQALDDLGLIEEREGRLAVNSAIAHGNLAVEEWFQAELRNRVMSSTQNTRLMASDEGTRELMKALAWFLGQAVDNPPASYNPKAATNSVTELLNEQFSSDEGMKSILRNSSRWPPFVRWAKYLGFVTFVPFDDGGPCPNPTRAVRDHLGALLQVFPEEVELPRFLEALANEIPVIDGGAYRVAVEKQVDVPPTSAGDDRRVSASMSLALLRLQDDGLIDLRRHSDSPATRALSLRPGHQASYSHVQILTREQAT